VRDKGNGKASEESPVTEVVGTVPVGVVPGTLGLGGWQKFGGYVDEPTCGAAKEHPLMFFSEEVCFG
jgi:hypothetical protein